MVKIVFCTYFLLTFFIDLIGCSKTNNEVLLFERLFQNGNYSALVRPVKNTSTAVDVLIDVAFVQLVTLDDRDQSMTSNMWIRLYWKNEFLNWNPGDFGNLKSIVIDKQWIWTPDIVLYNSADTRLNGQLDQHKTRIIVNHKGQNTWYIPAILIAGCSIDIRYFPFDYQKVYLTFGSWTYLRHELNIIPVRKTMDLSSYLNSSDFRLVATTAKRTEKFYDCCPNPYVDVTYSVLLQREPGFYTFNTIIPSLVLTFFTLITFALPVEIGERMGLAIDCFLTISILMEMVSDSIPVDSNVTPLLVKFLIVCIIAMTLTIFINGICLNMIGSVPMPWWLRDLVFKKIGPLVMWRSCIRKKHHSCCKVSTICEEIFVAKVKHHHEEENESTASDDRLDLLSLTVNAMKSNDIKMTSMKKNDNIGGFCKKDVKNIKLLAGNAVDDIEGENIAETWRCISQAIDRMLLLLFTVVYVTVNVTLLLQVPKVNLN